MRPVLAEEAVEGATVEKERQVVVTHLRTLRDNVLRISASCGGGAPPSVTAVGHVRVEVVVQEALLGGREAPELSALYSSDAAVPQLSLAHHAPSSAKVAWYTSGGPGRIGRKAELGSVTPVVGERHLERPLLPSFKHFLQTPIALEMSGDVTPQTAQVAKPPL